MASLVDAEVGTTSRVGVEVGDDLVHLGPLDDTAVAMCGVVKVECSIYHSKLPTFLPVVAPRLFDFVGRPYSWPPFT